VADYYTILGVTPASEDVVIRAAYRALMRRYHPDTDPSSAALQRVQAINAAYAVLGDPEKRARYDGSLAAQGLIRPDPHPPRRSVARLLPRPGAAIGLAALAAAAVAVATWPLADLPVPSLPLGQEQRPPRAAAQEEMRAAAEPAGASDRCASTAASGLIRDELFRRAARLRGSDAAGLGRVASHALVRIESSTRSSQAGAAGCHGFVALDLPPGLVVDGGRTNLTAEVAYGLVERTGGRLDLASLTGANALIRSLATVAPEQREETAPVIEPVPPPKIAEISPPAATPLAKPAPAKSVDKPAGPKVAPASTAKKPAVAAKFATSFNCSVASAAAEKTICASGNLAALDRQAALLYSQSWGQANEAKRSALLQTRAQFVDRRNKCGSEACLTSAYLARMREMADIMAGRQKP
jgi:curved DNA-binding protein CbpA